MMDLDTISVKDSNDYQKFCSVFGHLKNPIIILNEKFEPIYYNSSANSTYRILCLKGVVKSYLSPAAIQKARGEVEIVGISRIDLDNNTLFKAFIFTKLIICKNTYYRFQVEEAYSFNENIERLFGNIGLVDIVKNELLNPASNLVMLLPLLRNYCVSTPETVEKFNFFKNNIYMLTRSASKIAELTGILLSMTSASKTSVRVSSLADIVDCCFENQKMERYDIDNAVTVIDLDVFNKIILDVIDYMAEMESLTLRKKALEVSVYVENNWAVFKFIKKSVASPDLDAIFSVNMDMENINSGYFRAKTLSELNGCLFEVDYIKRTRAFVTKFSVPLLLREKVYESLAQPEMKVMKNVIANMRKNKKIFHEDFLE